MGCMCDEHVHESKVANSVVIIATPSPNKVLTRINAHHTEQFLDQVCELSLL